MADIITRPLPTIFERLWRSGEVHGDWRKANVAPISIKGRKGDLGNYRADSLTLGTEKIMEQV